MTTYQGIAVATQTLRQVAWDALRVAVPGAVVTLDRPEESPAAARDEPRLNIYLIQVGFEATMRNNDLPTRESNGSLVAVPQVPLTLRYLFSYFGPTPTAHLMLGAIETALHQTPGISPQAISRAVEQHQNLLGSGLERQQPPVQIVPGSITLEDLARFWSGFFQMPYTLSTVHDVTPVILSADVTPSVVLPVRQPAPTAGGLAPQLDPLPALSYTPGLRVPVSGVGVVAGQYVGLDGAWSEIEAGSDGRLGFALPAAVAAGTHQAQLGAVEPSRGSSLAPIPGSRTVSFQLRPEVRWVRFTRATGVLQVEAGPELLPGQNVTLGLYSLAPGGEESAWVSTTVSQTVTERSPTVTFPAPSLPPGDYLAILTVDGVASLPIFAGGRYSQPSVQLT